MLWDIQGELFEGVSVVNLSVIAVIVVGDLNLFWLVSSFVLVYAHVNFLS